MSSDSPGQAVLSTPDWVLGVAAEPFRIELRSAVSLPQPTQAKPLWRLVRVLWRTEQGHWQQISTWRMTAQSGDGCTLQGLCAGNPPGDTSRAPAIELACRLSAGTPSVSVEIIARPETGAAWVAADVAAAEDEHFLGFGERFDQIERRGTQVDLQVINGASGGLAYKPVPFFMSSAGYGLHIATDFRTVVRVATPDDPQVVSIRCSAPSLTLRVIPGRSFKEILAAYTAAAGRPALPPQ